MVQVRLSEGPRSTVGASSEKNGLGTCVGAAVAKAVPIPVKTMSGIPLGNLPAKPSGGVNWKP